ncbi:hypothetical protein MCUN1_001605 [Malassezia cuniculi]|uniref:Glutathione hydrolase n=1 Tax=Malassezia cuniculi TaxID=948313 RepID=A0AAF0EQL2_9BASI|nr:hypothetical protein MCUN1_001605 [Malassezia cuniculi]
MLVLGALSTTVAYLLAPLTLITYVAQLAQLDDTPVYMRVPSQGYRHAYSVEGHNGAVACEVDMCSASGAYIMERGGSAVDGAIAAALCVGVVDAFHSGIGGGGLALVKQDGRTPVVFDYRETAPAAAHTHMFDGMPAFASRWGGLAAAVPGEVRGYEELHKEHGKVPWELLFEPAIQIARRGFRLPKQVYYAMYYVGPVLCKVPKLGGMYCDGMRLKQPGAFMIMPELADTLEKIAKDGPDAFYSGEIAQGIVDTLARDGGIMTLEDLAGYRVERREPLSLKLDGHRVWSVPAPGSGAVVLAVLHTMSHYAPEPYNRSDGLANHRLIEATKFAYGVRTTFGDPAFIKNVSVMEQHAISAREARRCYESIRDGHVQPVSAYNPRNISILNDRGTSHLSAVDKHGLSVSMTTTINLFFGNLMITPQGVLLNNEMDDFSRPDVSNAFDYEPQVANYIKPGKRPMSSMSPVIVEDATSGEVRLVVGASGGSRIISANVINTYSFLNRNDSRAMIDIIAEARWHDQLLPQVTYLEQRDPRVPGFKGFSKDAAADLKRRGHNITWIEPGWSNAQAIERTPDGRFFAATEARQVDSRGAAI